MIYGCYSNCAPLENIPIQITQPDGTVLFCYTSGDEFYHWLHDENGNIIVQDSISGFYCYMIEGTDSLVIASNNSLPVMRYSKYSYDINKLRHENIEFYDQIKNKPYLFAPSHTRSFTNINNIVIFITFSDQDDYVAFDINIISTMHNDSSENANSLKNYYWASSYNQLKVNSYIYPTGMTNYSYKDIYPRQYYCPFSSDNPLGYNTLYSRKLREDSLLIRAITYIQGQIPSDLNLDTDNDGKVDNICFIIKGGTTEWNTLLWPHQWSLWQNKYINGKKVYDYNIQLSDFIFSHGVGVLCHEFGHTLGLPDLYHGYADSTGYTWKPVGRWDIMSSNGYYPQQTSGYMKCTYLHWINEIPEITKSGRYKISPISYSPQCYKISIEGSNEFLYLEYRKRNLAYDSYIPESGLIIYRINPSKSGNFNATTGGGKDDKVYVYRPNGNFLSDGNLDNAPFSIALNKTKFNATTNPQEFLSDGGVGNVYISNVQESDSTISFNVKICSSEDIIYVHDSNIPTYTNGNSIMSSGNVVIENDSTFFEASDNIVLNGGFKVLEGSLFRADVIPCE